MDRLKARWTVLALAATVVAGVAATGSQVGQGIGSVNLQIIMPQTPGYQEAQTAFEAEFQPATEDWQAMVAQRDSLLEEYDRTSVVLSPTARQGKETEIQQLQARIEQRATDLQNRQAERERELMEPLELRVQSVIEGIRAERNLAVIFDMATVVGIAAIDQTIDLTPIVVQRLQQSQPDE
jgi:Skp family chaperone for outer membrane proteins